MLKASVIYGAHLRFFDCLGSYPMSFWWKQQRNGSFIADKFMMRNNHHDCNTNGEFRPINHWPQRRWRFSAGECPTYVGKGRRANFERGDFTFPLCGRSITGIRGNTRGGAPICGAINFASSRVDLAVATARVALFLDFSRGKLISVFIEAD